MEAMNEAAIIILIGLALLLIPAGISQGCAEISHQRRLKRLAAAQKRTHEDVHGRAAK